MLEVIQSGIDYSHGLGNLLPALQFSVVEGAFGAGPGATARPVRRAAVAARGPHPVLAFRCPEAAHAW